MQVTDTKRSSTVSNKYYVQSNIRCHVVDVLHHNVHQTKNKKKHGQALADLSWTDFDGETVPLVRELDDLWPHKAMCSEPIMVEKKTNA